MASEQVVKAVKALCEGLVMAELTDLVAFADLHTQCQTISKALDEAGEPQLASVGTALEGLIESIILAETDDPQATLDVLNKAATALHTVICDGAPFDAANFPAAVVSGGEPVSEGDRGFELPAYIDEEILTEFLTRQTSVLSEVETHILSIEKGASDDDMGALRRHIHTIKGEAAMLGMADVERLCHTAEDALDKRPATEIADALLAVKDWLARTFEAFSGKGSVPANLDALLAQLEGRAPADTASAPTEAPDDTPAEAEPTERTIEGDVTLLGDFCLEANEHLENADVSLLTIETDPRNEEALNAVFRAFHTIKGVAGFLALNEIQSLAHEAENLLDNARKGELELSGVAIDVTFDAIDHLKRLIQNLGDALSSGAPAMVLEPGLRALVARIQAVVRGEVPAQEIYPPSSQKLGEILVETGAATETEIAHGLEKQQQEPGRKKIGDVLVESGGATRGDVNRALAEQSAHPEKGKVGEILVEMHAANGRQINKALEKQQTDVPEHPKLGEALVRGGEVAPKDVAKALRAQNVQRQGVKVREAVKVDADRLDRLIDLIGELVIAESMVTQSDEMKRIASAELSRHINLMDKITRELQEMGMSLRMVPVRNTFQKMARLVRDVAKKSGKHVDFAMSGEDTELDKSVVDKIGDPLVHMVRNAVDHGLEASAEDRLKAGKPELGRVELRAFHKGGNIYIEIEDDGRGLDRDAIMAKALERGLVKDGETLSDRDVYNLIFEPGFSTAKKITDVSGRGVGMDVVRRNIEALRGQVEIQSVPGKGSVFSMRLPLTLAIIDGMVVGIGDERYIIPTLSIVSSIRPDETDVSTVVGRGEMMKLQGQLIPMFHVADLFDVPNAKTGNDETIVVVVEDEGKRTGLVVDEILGQQQIVIKTLGESMQGIPGISGGAIMPDGQIGLIMDVGGLVKLATDATGAVTTTAEAE